MTGVVKTIRSRKGLALVTVLWVAMLMIVLVSVTSQSTLLDTHISQVNVERQRCRWACRAGIETAIALLVEDDPGYDCLLDDWAPDAGYLSDLDFDGCTVQVTVTDTASKLNLNTVSRQQLLFLPDMTEEIADSIIDWRDDNDQISEFGAEDGYYMNLDIGYRTQNGSFRTTRELLRVRGVTEAMFYGNAEQGTISDENAGWVHYLTFLSSEANVDSTGESKIDINNAGQQQLQQTLSLTPPQAQWIVNNRSFEKYSDVLKETSPSSSNTNSAPPSNTNETPSQGQQNQRNQRGQRNQGNQGNRGNRDNQQNQPATPPDIGTALNIIDNAALNNEQFYTGRVNINTAGVIVLTALLEGNRELAETIVAYRDGLAGGFTGMADLQDIEGMSLDAIKKLVDLTSVRSSVYEIDCAASSNATGLTFHTKVIINREEDEGKILYWREGNSH